MVKFIKARRASSKAVPQKIVQRQALVSFAELYPNANETFAASNGWFNNFMRRNNIVFRRVTTSVGQKIPVDAPERCDVFLDSMKGLQNFDQYYNMDETPCYFDLPRAGSYDFQGSTDRKAQNNWH